MHIFIYHYRIFVPLFIVYALNYGRYILLFLLAINYLIVPLKISNKETLPIEMGVFTDNTKGIYSNFVNSDSELQTLPDLNKKTFSNNLFKIDSLATNLGTNNFFEPIFPTDKERSSPSPFEVSKK